MCEFTYLLVKYTYLVVNTPILRSNTPYLVVNSPVLVVFSVIWARDQTSVGRDLPTPHLPLASFTERYKSTPCLAKRHHRTLIQGIADSHPWVPLPPLLVNVVNLVNLVVLATSLGQMPKMEVVVHPSCGGHPSIGGGAPLHWWWVDPCFGGAGACISVVFATLCTQWWNCAPTRKSVNFSTFRWFW